MATIERPIVQHYGLPIASYRDAVWPVMSQPSPYLPCYWNGLSHPDALGHKLIGDVVAYGLLAAAMHANADDNIGCTRAPPPVAFHNDTSGRRFCSKQSKGTFMSTSQPELFKPVSLSGCWSFYEDRPRKPGELAEHSPPNHQTRYCYKLGLTVQPSLTRTSHAGWICQLNETVVTQTNTIMFRIEFSDTPQLQVTYLTSYLGMGQASLTLHREGGTMPVANFTLDGRTPNKFSTPYTSIWVGTGSIKSRDNQPHVQRMPEAVHQGVYIAAIQPVGEISAKFKLLGLSTC